MKTSNATTLQLVVIRSSPEVSFDQIGHLLPTIVSKCFPHSPCSS